MGESGEAFDGDILCLGLGALPGANTHTVRMETEVTKVGGRDPRPRLDTRNGSVCSHWGLRW